MIVVLVYVAWSSVGREPFDLTPEQLIKTAGEAQDMIERTQSDCLLPGANRNPPKPMRQATLYSEVAKKIRQDILEDKYLLKTDLDRPPIDLPHLRPPLTALTVEGVRGSGGHGAVRSLATAVGNAFAENRGMTGTRWVVLTGLIPLQKQLDEALDAYRETLPPFDPVRDIPQIVWFQVERAEVGAKADLDHLEWSPVSVKKAWAFYNRFQGSHREVVSENYMYNTKDLPLVFPLPPTGDDHIWGDEVVHLPEIPAIANRQEDQIVKPRFLNQPGQRSKPKPHRPVDVETAKPEANEPDVPDLPPDNSGTGEGPNPPVPGGPVAPPIPGKPFVGPIPGGANAGGRTTFVPLGGGGPKRIGMIPGGGGDSDQASPVKLFRFFDFTVQPGKQYRYRVQLWWTNPNCAIPRQYLVNPDDAKESYVKTEWSAPSESVGVPRDARILAGEVIKQHPERCKAGIAYFDIASGSEAFETLEVERGQWLNFSGRTLHNPRERSGYRGPMPVGPPLVSSHHETVKPVTHGSSTSKASGHHPPPPPPHPPTRVHPEPGPAAGTELAEVKVDYVTDTLLLDVSGGAKITPSHDPSLREPGHILLLDPQGNLVVLHELTDEDEIKSLSPSPDKGLVGPKAPKPGPKTNKKDKGNGLDALMGPPTPKKPSYKKTQ